ncbi:hypothetical protein BH11PSE7_BH11PSE7_18350 [soil metagenome]
MNKTPPLHGKYLLCAIAAAAALLVAGCGDGENNAPVASAGVAQNVKTGTTVTLDASASTDFEGDKLTYAWTLVSKPAGSTATITNATSAKATLVPEFPGVYTAKVTVSDGNKSSEATVTVTTGDVLGFDFIPTPFPASYPSYSFQAYSIMSIGDQITLATGVPHTLGSFEVGMSSYSCQTGTQTAACTSTPGATFQHPMTVNFYNNAGVLLATKTQTMTMAYRPSADPTCANPVYYRDSSGTCAPGFPFKVTFDLHALRAAVPDSFYYELQMNTSTSGPAPVGTPGPYDSLNVGVANPMTVMPTVGSDPKPNVVRFDGVEDTGDPGLLSRLYMVAP